MNVNPSRLSPQVGYTIQLYIGVPFHRERWSVVGMIDDAQGPVGLLCHWPPILQAELTSKPSKFQVHSFYSELISINVLVFYTSSYNMNEPPSVEPASELTQTMTRLENTSQSVYRSFAVGQQFVNGIDDYVRFKRSTHKGLSIGSFGPAWTKFKDVGISRSFKSSKPHAK